MENTTKEQLVDTYVANIELNVELDNLKNKYGFSSIKRASELNKKTN